MARTISHQALMARIAAGAACVLPLVAHALSEEPLSMVYELPQVATSRDGLGPLTAQEVKRSCALVVQLADSRASKSTLGGNAFLRLDVGGTPVVMQSIRSGDGLPWLRGAIRSLESQGFRVAEGGAAGTAAIAQVTMDIHLRMAQAWASGTNLASTVAIEARYKAPMGEAARTYVGQGMKANWANGDSEYMGVLNAAMADAVASLAQDAAGLCEGRALAASNP